MRKKIIIFFLFLLGQTIFAQNINDIRFNQPKNFSATSNGSSITLKWTSDNDGMRIYRSLTGHEPWERPAGGKFISSARQFTDTDNLRPNRYYYYAIESYQGKNRSPLSTFIRIRLGDSKNGFPDNQEGPINVRATRVGNDVRINWDWVPKSQTAKGFKLERAVLEHRDDHKLSWAGNEWNPDRTISNPNARSFTDKNVGPGIYVYRVFAYTDSKNLTFSENIEIQVTDGTTTSNQLTLNPSNRNVSNASGTTTFAVSSNVSWTVSESVDWLSIASSNTGSNNGSITVNYNANGTSNQRTGTIRVSGGGLTRNVTVTQSGSNDTPPPPPDVMPIPQNVTATVVGGTIRVDWQFQSTSAVTGFKILRQFNSGPEIRPEGGKIQNANARSYTDEANLPDGTYSYTVRAYYKSDSEQNYPRSEAAVASLPGDVTSALTVTPANRNVSNGSGSTPFSVSSDVGWSVSSNADWLTVSPGSGSNNGTLTANYESNGTSSQRVGTITVTGGGITRNVTVTQSGSNDTPPPPPQDEMSVPQNVIATVVGGTIRVDWEWPYSTSKITGFKIERKYNSGSWMRPSGGKIRNINARSYTDDTDLPDGKYSYKVRAYYKSDGEQNYPLSESAIAQIPGGEDVPNDVPLDEKSIPINVTVTIVGGTIRVDWEWPYSSSNLTGFKIERQYNSGPWMRPVGGKIRNVNVRSFTDEADLPNGTYSYKVRAYYSSGGDQNFPLSEPAAIQINNNAAISKIASKENELEALNEIPKEYVLFNNYPNPFNPTTKIKFSLVENETVNLIIYNVMGEEVMRTIDNKKLGLGNHEVEVNMTNLASGIYIYRLSAGKFIATKRMILMK